MTSTTRGYFEDMYRDRPDPWEFETSDYERRKYALTMAALPKERYTSCFEPGCSIGVLTEQLARRCDRLLATDIIPATLDTTRRRLEGATHVAIEQRAIPEEWPLATFDLVVLSEIAYYFDEPELEAVLERTLGSTTPGSHVVGVHWRGETDYPLSGDGAHQVIDATPGLDRVVHHLEAEFTLDIWERL